MPRFRSTDPTRTPRNSLIAAGLLVAVACLLIGFHGTTMVLSAISMTEQQSAEAKPKPEPERTPVARAVPPPADAPVAAPENPPAPPTGVAAAAKAKALAEMRDMEPNVEPAMEPALELERPQVEETPRQRPRRVYRAPRADKHKVY